MQKKRSLVLLLPIYFLFLFAACSSGDNSSLVRHYSETILDSGLRLGNNGLSGKALQLVKAHFDSLGKMSVMDRYRYYRFHFDLYFSYYSTAYNPAAAESYADSMLLLLEEHGLPRRLPQDYAMACNLKGQVCIEEQRYAEAFRLFSLSRAYAARAGDSCLLAQYNSTLGTVRFRQGRYGEAADFYKRALAAGSRCQGDATAYHDTQGWLDNLALTYTRMGMPDSALVYYHAAAKYIAEFRHLYTADTSFPQIAMAVVDGNEALALEAKGEYAQAEYLLKKSMAVNSRPGYDHATSVIERLHLAELYLRTKRVAGALPLLDYAGTHLPEGDEGTKLLWMKLMGRYYSATNNDGRTSDFLEASLRFVDSVTVRDRHRYAENEDHDYQLVEDQMRIGLLKKDNTISRILLWGAAAVALLLGIITTMIIRNLSRQRRMVAGMRQKNDALDGLVRDKDRILRVVAHDLRSPIGGIRVMSQMIAGKEPAKQEEMLGFIQRSAADCLTMVNALLVEHPDGGEMQLDLQPMNLGRVVEDSVHLMQFNAGEKEQTILADVDEPGAMISGDAAQLKRVFQNLIGNAIKFSPRGAAIAVSLKAAAEGWRVMVRDRGIGIPDALRAHLFESFTSARRFGTGGERSFGLGLSISKKIVEAHGGHIGFESEEGKGTEFVVVLPR